MSLTSHTILPESSAFQSEPGGFLLGAFPSDGIPCVANWECPDRLKVLEEQALRATVDKDVTRKTRHTLPLAGSLKQPCVLTPCKKPQEWHRCFLRRPVDPGPHLTKGRVCVAEASASWAGI